MKGVKIYTLKLYLRRFFFLKFYFYFLPQPLKNMKPISLWTPLFVVVLAFYATNAKHGSHSKSTRMFAFRNFGSLNYQLTDLIREASRRNMAKMKKEKQEQEEILKQKEEEKFRKIVNERLMPLTRGNKFMRDFYSGRY
jgi:hypothetical protein